MGWLLDCDAIEMVINGGFDADTDWIHTGNITIAGGKCTYVPVGAGILSQQLFGSNAAKPYWFQIDIDVLPAFGITLTWSGVFQTDWRTPGHKTFLFLPQPSDPDAVLLLSPGLVGSVIDNVSVLDIGAQIACTLGLIVSETARYEVTPRTPPYIEVKIADPAHGINILVNVNTDDL